ncbi:hypothetical protein [uncultured Draconibacterium sp.]|uniref:hypothetical protein n=1 Tax=uncultured Draconibacterium sp. TaxID=1573823 RepID=UPI0032162883
MDKIDLHLENCYGIKKLIHSFDFTKSPAHLVYAPNGVMKSSLARTLEDIANEKDTKDRIFTERINHRDVKVDARDIDKEEIFVIQRMKEADFKEASTILANEDLKKKYDEINSTLNKSKNDYIKQIKDCFGLRNQQVETEISNTYKKDLFSSFESIETQVNEIIEPIYAGIKYNEIFNDKVLKFLGNSDFKTKIKDYITTYDKLVNKNDTLFMKGTFNHYNADTVTKALKDNKFFKAKHKVKIKESEIETVEELEELINTEKEKVLTDPELASKFNAIDKSLNSNADLRKFRNYVEQNQEIIKEFINLENFRKKLIANYIASNKEEFNVLLKLYRDTNEQRKIIIEEAKKEQDDWKNVLEIFKRRFTVPFKLKIKNQEDVILKEEPASLIFEYSDGVGPDNTKELGGPELYDSLSTGEQRVFYLLNIIFQIETRRRLGINQLVVVDDIADSFDYKNKYAIIEYLKDVLEEPTFKMIILTHNFDFYKTVKSRLGAKINYQGNWKTLKNGDELSLVIGEKKDVFPTLRNNFDTCDVTFIACIPFVRNLIEFSIGKDNNSYYLLTSLLHLKPEITDRSITQTKDITKQEVFDIFNSVFATTKSTDTPDKKVYELVFEKSNEIIAMPQDDSLDIKNKICLSLAIRLIAEEYMLSKITDANFHTHIQNKQTGQIVDKFRKEFPGETEEISVLDRVNLMTAENIHFNSFMYEPLMDLTDDHLRNLFNDVKNLN